MPPAFRQSGQLPLMFLANRHGAALGGVKAGCKILI
jgi:hypothetical protein